LRIITDECIARIGMFVTANRSFVLKTAIIDNTAIINIFDFIFSSPFVFKIFKAGKES
jgi:hypothetical protein